MGNEIISLGGSDDDPIALGGNDAEIGMEAPRHRKVGIIGARGYVAGELMRLLDAHPTFDLVLASSRALAGRRVRMHVEGVDSDLEFEALSPDDLDGRDANIWVLALPNGESAPWLERINARNDESVVIDVSTDHRFDPDWVYGLTERFRPNIRGARRIANPGCYATGIQLALWPLLGLLEGAPHVFGVSGYSGAGTKPSPKNDPEMLRDNLLPYKLCEHAHEREARHHLDHHLYFSPHVAPFFRGITLTISFALAQATTASQITARLRDRYADEALVKVTDEAPLVRDNAERHHVAIGGATVESDGLRGVLVVTLDNLLKGAATQALQNLNLAVGLHELAGIDTWLDS